MVDFYGTVVSKIVMHNTFFSGGHESAQTNVSCICGHSFCFRIDLQRKAKTCYNSLVECKIAM